MNDKQVLILLIVLGSITALTASVLLDNRLFEIEKQQLIINEEIKVIKSNQIDMVEAMDSIINSKGEIHEQ